ncbi:MAG: DUF885 domain-containing protein, partial [Phycisphaerales bacterium]|nr:DUF885 domain-containing protein [Phycisphaerales bacterium]
MTPRTLSVMLTIPFLLAIGGCAAREPEAVGGVSVAVRMDDDALVQALLDEDLDANRRFNPVQATSRGDRRFDDQWPDVSEAGRAAVRRDAEQRLVRLNGVDLDALSEENRVNAELLRYELEQRLAAPQMRLYQVPVTQLGGPQSELPQLPDSISLSTPEEEEDYITRLETVPAYLQQVAANLRLGLADGFTPPRIIMGPAADQALEAGSDVYRQDPTRHPMYKHFVGRDDARARRAAAAIRDQVVPAFSRFGTFLRDVYIPGCRDTIAAADLPDGITWYDQRLQFFTTLPLTAEEIHQTGLAEVARIKAEMMEVIARSDFPQRESLSGDELFAAFVQYLRTEPRFYFTDPDDLLAAYRVIAKDVDPWMTRLFGTLPRLSYGVREMPPFIARSSPTAYYYPGSLQNGIPGYFVANTWRLDQRPRYDMIPLTLHEAVPGHHHQVALSQELEELGLHEWRTGVWYTAFSEGWGLYAESLGLEMGEKGGRGLYEDPYDDFGRLNFEMWRAMRLVVDTGMHAKGWTRQQAIDFMTTNSALTAQNIEAEVNRYISWPGQAVAYK